MRQENSIGGSCKRSRKYTDTAQISSYLAQTSGDEHVANLLEAIKFLKAQPSAQAQRLGVTGFCFGGGLTWRLATEVRELLAAVPFYGPAPDIAKVPNIKAAVLGIYGGNDSRINAGILALETALKAAGANYKCCTPPILNGAPLCDKRLPNQPRGFYCTTQPQRAVAGNPERCSARESGLSLL
ncbi:MAG: dienelactone hydrolase family protein [Deinococcales bacterium]